MTWIYFFTGKHDSVNKMNGIKNFTKQLLYAIMSNVYECNMDPLCRNLFPSETNINHHHGYYTFGMSSSESCCSQRGPRALRVIHQTTCGSSSLIPKWNFPPQMSYEDWCPGDQDPKRHQSAKREKCRWSVSPILPISTLPVANKKNFIWFHM